MSLMRQQHVTLVFHTIKGFSRRFCGNLLHTTVRAASPVWEAEWLPPPRRNEVSRPRTSERSRSGGRGTRKKEVKAPSPEKRAKCLLCGSLSAIGSRWWGEKRSTCVDSEPQIAQMLKAIREKKERFFESRKVTGCARILARVLRVKAATGGQKSRGGYGIPAETESAESARMTPM